MLGIYELLILHEDEEFQKFGIKKRKNVNMSCIMPKKLAAQNN